MRYYKSGNFIPNTKTVASYCPVTNIIALDEIELNRLKEILNDPLLVTNYKDFKTIIHENRHRIDIESTYYGIMFNIMNYSRLQVVIPNFKVEEADKVVNFYEKLSDFKIDDYYHSIKVQEFIDKEYSNWSVETTIGSKLNGGIADHSKPIIFVYYYNKGNEIARIPLSLASMLEVNAVATELIVHNAFINKYGKTFDGSKLKFEILQDEMSNLIYNSELFQYSVVAQLVSIVLKIGNIIIAYYVAERISNLALNIPKALYKDLKIPESGNKIFDIHNRAAAFRQNCDPTFAFYCLLHNYKEKCETINEEIELTIDDLLSASNLPDLEKLYSIANKEIEEEFSKLAAINDLIKPENLRSESIEDFNKMKVGNHLELNKSYFEIDYSKIICSDEILDDRHRLNLTDSFYSEVDRRCKIIIDQI